MGEDDDEFSVNTSDQTVNEPTSEPTTQDPPQIDNPDEIGAQGSDLNSSGGEEDSSVAGSSDSSAYSISASDDTAHEDYQPPADPPQPTIGPDDRSDSDDGRPEEQHDEERGNPNEWIEQESERDVEEPPA
jgi:hypothetical protein